MRPTRLEVAGFTAFREPAVLDFEGCDFFALTGATGAGKSSLIDAIVFALYGSIPRLDKNAVAPLVSQGMLEARVRLDFTIDAQSYTIVRAVTLDARTGAASRSEARLERGGETLAGDAKSVSAEIARLIGLSFDQFTKCVVLPQGEFARFLHDTPKERQTLLVTLLELEHYRRMGERARECAAVAGDRTRRLQQKLDEELSYATADSRAEAAARLEQLQSLRSAVEEAVPRIDELTQTITTAEAEVSAARERLERLRGISVPAGIRDVGTKIREAHEVWSKANQLFEASEHEIRSHEDALAALPPRAPLEHAVVAHAQRDAALLELKQTRTALATAIESEEIATKAVAEAQAIVAGTESAWETARIEHLAEDLAHALVPGDPCPVCRQVVATKPEFHVPADLAATKAALDEAIALRDAAENARRTAEKGRAAAEAHVTAAASRVDALDASLAEHPDLTAVRQLLQQIDAAEGAVAEARARATASSDARKRAHEALEDVKGVQREIQKRFDAQRDAVADLGPPPASRDDPAEDWEALAGWAAERMEQVEAEAAQHQQSLAATKADRQALAARLEEIARDAGVWVQSGERLRDAAVRACVEQELVLERIDGALKEIEAVQAERKNAEEEHQVATTLGRHMSTKGFEKWLLDEAVQRLVDSASERLLALSSGGYSLTADSKTGAFFVIDHRNANESRSVKTLSGGETFLASLALALALADDLGRMAAQGVRLDSIFLDEGFGTLDPESLQVAVDGVETLTENGRMVGIVTHIPEVAERVPVRFQVRRDPDTSRVERIER